MRKTGLTWLVVAILSCSVTNTWGQQYAGPGANGPPTAPLPPPGWQAGRSEATAPGVYWEPRRQINSSQALGPSGTNEPGPGFVPAKAVAATEPIPPCADGVTRRSFWEGFKSHMQWSHWGYPEEFQKVPIGTSFRANRQVQIANGQAAGLVLYRYDFCDETGLEGPGLNAHGQKRLYLMLVQCRLGGGHPLVIERTPDNPQLDLARRNFVLKVLNDARVSSAVVVGEPLAKGMPGAEALLLGTSVLGQTVGSAGSGGGASGGGSQ
ncbi:MAG: hypothetical protein NTY19_00770 [Planctomycetota bacterium]|nr:hypothetical protein [Planctomycetota bacterium]